MTLAQVDKVYKRYFTCGGYKWRLDGLHRCMGGNRWHRPSIKKATQEDIETIVRQTRRDAVCRFAWAKAPQDLIDAVYKLLPPTP